MTSSETHAQLNYQVDIVNDMVEHLVKHLWHLGGFREDLTVGWNGCQIEELVSAVKLLLRDAVHFVEYKETDLQLWLLNSPLRQETFGNVIVMTLEHRVVAVVVVELPTIGTCSLLGTQMFDQLIDLLVFYEGFRQVGPVLGIMTTGKEWRFCWLSNNANHFGGKSQQVWACPRSQPEPEGGHVLKRSYTDPRPSPLLSVKVQATRVLHVVEDRDVLTVVMGTLIARMLVNARTFHCKTNYIAYRGTKALTWHTASDIPYDAKVVWELICRVPRSPGANADRLILTGYIRDAYFGTWVALTIEPDPAICVLIFRHDNCAVSLRKELEAWHTLYPEFKQVTRLEMWSGRMALCVPSFRGIGEDPTMRDSIEQMLRMKFGGRYIHDEVSWWNLGYYVSCEEKVPVLFTLAHVRERVAADGDVESWIARVMWELYQPQKLESSSDQSSGVVYKLYRPPKADPSSALVGDGRKAMDMQESKKRRCEWEPSPPSERVLRSQSSSKSRAAAVDENATADERNRGFMNPRPILRASVDRSKVLQPVGMRRKKKQGKSVRFLLYPGSSEEC